MNTQATTQDPHKWEANATTREIGVHTRHFMEILGRFEDSYTELIDLVEATGITNPLNIDSYTGPALESFCTFRTEARKLMFDHITENLGGLSSEI